MEITLAVETSQLINLAGWVAGIVLALIVFAVGLAEVGARFVHTQIP